MMRCLALCLALAGTVWTPQAALARPAEPAAETGSTRNLYMMLIQKARSDGRPRAALAYLDDFDRHHPGDAEARVLRVNCLLDLGQVDAAKVALAQVPTSDRQGAAVRGHVLAAQGAWTDAAVQYAAAQAADPANPLTGNALGYALLRAGRTAEAIERLKNAHDLAPGNAVIRNNLLLALTAAGRHGEVETILATMRDATARTMLRGQIADQSVRLSAQVAQP